MFLGPLLSLGPRVYGGAEGGGCWLLMTMLLYSLATAGCALSTNIWMLIAFRVVARLGIGGE